MRVGAEGAGRAALDLEALGMYASEDKRQRFCQAFRSLVLPAIAGLLGCSPASTPETTPARAAQDPLPRPFGQRLAAAHELLSRPPAESYRQILDLLGGPEANVRQWFREDLVRYLSAPDVPGTLRDDLFGVLVLPEGVNLEVVAILKELEDQGHLAVDEPAPDDDSRRAGLARMWRLGHLDAPSWTEAGQAVAAVSSRSDLTEADVRALRIWALARLAGLPEAFDYEGPVAMSLHAGAREELRGAARDPDLRVRATALREIGKIDGAWCWQLLADALASPATPEKTLALRGLAARWRSGATWSSDEDLADPIGELALGGTWQLEESAVLALSALGRRFPQSVAPWLERVVQDGSNRPLALLAAATLPSLPESFLARLRALAASDEPTEIRTAAGLALGVQGDSSAVPFLARIARDGDDETASNAVHAIGALKSRAGPRVLRVLEDLLQKDSAKVRREAVQALAACVTLETVGELRQDTLELARRLEEGGGAASSAAAAVLVLRALADGEHAIPPERWQTALIGLGFSEWTEGFLRSLSRMVGTIDLPDRAWTRSHLLEMSASEYHDAELRELAAEIARKLR